MKSGFVILLAGLFMLCLMPVQGVANQNTAVNFPVELGYDNFDREKPAGPCRDVAAPDNGPTLSRSYPVSLVGDRIEDREVVGPQRDWGDDWISYDDGESQWLMHWLNNAIWSRTRFTPPADFILEGVRFKVFNGNNIDPDDAPCRVYVYSEEDDRDLEDILWEGEADELPHDEWIDIEFDEDDYLEFAADEHFSIIYGPAPSRNPDEGGQGWWNCLDVATEVFRSFIAREDGRNPPTDHGDYWYEIEFDLLLRANGTFQADFFDAGISGLYNDTEKWLMYPGTEQVFTANIFYQGQPTELAIVSFNVYDSEGNAFWERPSEKIIVDPFDNMDPGDILEVECDSVWTAGEAGTYIVRAEIEIQNDANEDNNIFGMEQLVFDPEAEEPIWLGYCDETSESQFSGTEDEGWMVAFAHPGGHESLWLEKFRYWMDNRNNDQAVECRFRIGWHADGRWGWMMPQTFTVEIAANEEGWVEYELFEDERDSTSFPEGAEILVSYQYSGLSLKSDGTPPISGVNPDMPGTMWITIENGQQAGAIEAGDYMCQVQLGVSDIVFPGKLLGIEPEVLDFGVVNVGEEHRIEATFTAFGDDTVTIRRLEIAGSAEDYLTIDPAVEFIIEPQSEQTVTVTFYADTLVELDSRIRIINDSDNMSQAFIWDVLANAQSVDDANRPVMPENYALYQNYPNPFNPTTSIEFALRSAGDVKLNVFDMNGRLVKEVVNNHLGAGYHTVEIDANDLAAGIYIYRLTTGDFTSTRKMILMK